MSDFNDNDDLQEVSVSIGGADGESDMMRQMQFEERNRNSGTSQTSMKLNAIKQNLLTPVYAIKNTFQQAVQHPIKATMKAGITIAAGAAVARLGAEVGGQVNAENILSAGIATLPNAYIIPPTFALAVYGAARLTDAFAGKNWISEHRRSENLGKYGGWLTVAVLALLGNNIGDDNLRFYGAPFLDPINTGAKLATYIPDTVFEAVAEGVEGTHLDVWVDDADLASCAQNLKNHETLWGLPCRSQYFEGENISFMPVETHDENGVETDALDGVFPSFQQMIQKLGG